MARFSMLREACAAPRQFVSVKTADFATSEDAIQTSFLDRTSVQPRSAILAVAGPIESDEIPLTNCDWVVRPKQMLEALGLEDIIVINDFEAQALAISALDNANRDIIGPDNKDMIA